MASSASTRAPRSLADDLRARTSAQIRRLLALRPDLVQPWPADLSELARRAADDTSVLEAMQALDTPSLRVLEVLACLHEADATQVGEALGDAGVAGVLQDLWDRALVWGGPHVFRVVRAAQQAFGPYPCGLGPAGHASPDPDEVRQAALDLDPDRLRLLVWENPVSTTANPLAVTRGDQHVVPREVALILRDGRFLPPAAAPAAPEQAPPAPDDGLWTPLAGVRYVLCDLTRNPLAWHPARGITRRALTDRADAMRVPLADLVAWLELAAVAGLLGGSGNEVRPTAHTYAWLALPPAAMWQRLIEAWLDSDRLLPMCRPDDLGALTTAGRPRTALHRRHLLQCWPAGPVTDLREHLTWCRPRMAEAVAQADDVADELERLGLLVAGRPTSALQWLPDDVAGAARAVPSAEGGTLIVQPDLTVIAPLNLDSPTWSLLYDVARVESWGPVTMHRIDPVLLRAAVGVRDPQEVLDRLAAASRTPLPQSLEYLVRDAARVQPVRLWQATVVRAAGDDGETLRGLGFERIAEHTFMSAEPLDVVRQRLADSGLAIEADRPSEPGVPLEYPRTTAHDPHAVDRLVARLVGRDEAPAAPPPMQPVDPTAVVARCREAVATGHAVWLEFHDGGEALTHFVEPFELRSGKVSGWSLTAGRTVTIPLSRIAAMGAVDD